jgi:hypothetical protein
MGTPKPEANYIASDADYVDFITELMGGFSIPPVVKQLRQGKQYLLMGMRLNRDTERMVMADMIFSAAKPAGWVLHPNPPPRSAASVPASGSRHRGRRLRIHRRRPAC